MMDLKQIAQNLNEKFSKPGGRKLIFWYDAEAEFVDDVDTIELSNAKIHKLEKDNQFYTKYFLECKDTVTNYLVYATFPEPDVRENHLADTVKYSRKFYADKSSLICIDLNIPRQLKAVIEKHKKFFNAEARYSKFKELCIDKYDDKSIAIGMMSVICKCKTASFEEVLRAVLMENSDSGNKYMSEIEKFDLTVSFWSLCEEYYGYSGSEPSLEGLAIAFFLGAKAGLPVILLVCVLSGLGASASAFVPYTLLPDLPDTDEMITGTHGSGIYAGMATFVRTFSSGIAIFLTGIALDLFGYVESSAGQVVVQTPTALLGVRVMFTIVPILFTIAAVFLGAKYRLNKQAHAKMCAAIAHKRETGLPTQDEQQIAACEHISGIAFDQMWVGQPASPSDSVA